MDRIQILQKLIDKNNFKSYLEVGTFRGESFLPLKCKKKIAVDPKFQISKKEKFEWILKNPTNLGNRYFEMTSENFFDSQQKILSEGIDIVFIDGLHTFKASLNDVLNSIQYLNMNGVIVLHDCFPPHKAASLYASSEDEAMAKFHRFKGWTGEWCGDVWKTIIYLRRKYFKECDVVVLDTDYGLGIIQLKNKNENIDLEVDVELFEEVNKMSYEELMGNPEDFLNLKKIEHFPQIQ